MTLNFLALCYLFYSKRRIIEVNPYIIIAIGAILAVIGIIIFNIGKSIQHKDPKKSSNFTLIGFVLLILGLILILTAVRVLFS